MPRRLTNLLLLLLVLAALASGLLGWALPESLGWPLYDLHRLVASALLVLLVWKQLIVRASLERRLGRRPWDRSVMVGTLAGLVLLGSLALGLAWTLDLVSFDSFGGYSPLNIHIFLALAVLPFLLWHLLRRWERRPSAKQLASRRNALHLIGLGTLAVLAWQLTERAASAWALAGSRRQSGSKHAASFSGNDFPVTIWLFDPIPALATEAWTLQVIGNVARPASVSFQQLLSFPARKLTAVLDCTGGWWSEQVWQGISVGDVLVASGASATARTVQVVSVTGHRWAFPIGELRDALLATHVGGEPLTPGHGYPVRLVAPGRRGFQWVKWVGRLEVY